MWRKNYLIVDFVRHSKHHIHFYKDESLNIFGENSRFLFLESYKTSTVYKENSVLNLSARVTVCFSC
jgi:hypothetical protein